MELPGERLLLRLWETIAEKGIGSLLSPWQIRREGRARIDVRREEIVTLAQAERDAEDIRSGRKRLDAVRQLVALPEPETLPPVQPGEARAEDRPALRAAAQIATGNLVADAIQKQVNIAKAVLAAEAELEGDPQEPSARTVDDDWLFRWRDCASAVSSEELQNLWGRVLAGEVKSPGAFSLRTLEFLKNLSQQEAVEIAKLSRFAVADVIFRGDEALLNAEGITYGFLLGMQELGVVAGVEAMGLTLTLKSMAQDRFIRGLVSHDRVLLVTDDDPAKELKLHTCQLTLIGRQILRLGAFEPHQGYLRAVGQAIRGQGFKVQIARYQQVTETEIRYFDAEDL
ncbi:MAG: DUF2806 domain-containing protein [Thermoanaerobaculia bacterium]